MAQNSPLHLVLDIDGTLVDSEGGLGPAPDYHAFDAAAVYYRPGLLLFLVRCFRTFASVSVWTAGCGDWADSFVRSLPAEVRGRFAFVWSSRHMTQHRLSGEARATYRASTVPVKMLSRMWTTARAREMGMTKHTTVMVDDLPQNCLANVGNGVIVPAFVVRDWARAQKDAVLLRLFDYLRALAPPVRGVDKRAWLAASPAAPGSH